MRIFLLATFAALAACAIALPSVVRFGMDKELHFKSEKTKLQTYSFKNCMDPAKEVGYISSLIFKPDPLVFPGPLEVSFSVDIKSTVDAPLKGELLMAKKVGSTWIKIPCVGYIGSCSYDDICALLDQIPDCPPEFVQAGIGCYCPLKQGNYTMPGASFDVEVEFMPAGDYHLQANLTYNGNRVGCYDIMATFA